MTDDDAATRRECRMLKPYDRPATLPEYERPPVVEVRAGVQFTALPLRTVDIGAIYDRFQSEYPVLEERSPIPPQLEQFGLMPAGGIRFEFLNMPVLPMSVFLSSDRTRLVQVQRDRLECAWRRSGDAPYPRYSEIREALVRTLNEFADVTDNFGIQAIPVVQAEIVYVNELPAGPYENAFSRWRRARSGLLRNVEHVRVAESYVFSTEDGSPYARLHIEVEPAALRGERSEGTFLTLAFRGEPQLKVADGFHGITGIIDFLDQGHERIVTAFDASTTEAMHREWGKHA